MSGNVFNVWAGAPIVLEAVVGAVAPGFDPATAQAVLVFKRAASETSPASTVPTFATLTGAFVPAAGSAAAFWRFTHAAEDAPAFQPGTYAGAIRITLDGAAQLVTAPFFLRVNGGVFAA